MNNESEENAWLDPAPTLFEKLSDEESKTVINKMKNFKLKLHDDHLRVFAYRTPIKLEDAKKKLDVKVTAAELQLNDLYIYMLTNRRLPNNMQSTVEVEIFKWNDQGKVPDERIAILSAKAEQGRIYKVPGLKNGEYDAAVLRQDLEARKKRNNEISAEYNALKEEDKPNYKPAAKNARSVEKGERQNLFFALTVPPVADQSKRWIQIDKNGKEGAPCVHFYQDQVINNVLQTESDEDTQFWNKMPSCFKMASDGKGRLIFFAGSRSTWIYDLRLYNDQIQVWTKEDVMQGRAFGLQNKPFVTDIDFVDHNFTSYLTTKKEAKWLHTNVIHEAEDNFIKEIKTMTNKARLEKETLLRALPKILNAPDCSIDFLFAIEQQAITVVNKKTGGEYALVKQRAHCENDCIDDVFLTFERDITKESITKDGGEKLKLNQTPLKKITLHYFEKFFDYRKKVKPGGCTYNVFELTEDFLNMLTTCGEILPSEKTSLVSTIAGYKQPDKDEERLTVESIQAELDMSEYGYFNSEENFLNWLYRIKQHDSKVEVDRNKAIIQEQLDKLNK